MSSPAATEKLLCLTMLGYMKAGLTEDELYHFQIEKHAQLVSGLMEKYGVTRYTITHNTKATRALLPQLFDPSYVEFGDHDFIVRIIFPSIDVFLALKEDPVYRERIQMDHLNFADRKMKTKMNLGFVNEIIDGGKVLPVVEKSA
ncbi:hypothetical protein V493_07481 [Pseudogymnoascus sp. VKM F-4281 (FW-2241)]|nr:hypothetical protein V493_07481 [Pseudogymnoascus sp. VKM F-4281 (FW-2241)]